MAGKKTEVKASNKADTRLLSIENRLTALEAMAEKVISTEKDLAFAGDSYDELNSQVDDLDKVVQRIRTRMGI